jgi:thiamine biosynthesis protein ThiS
MNITVNGEKKDVPAEATILSVVESLGFAAATVVVQQNDDIIPRDAYGDTRVKEGDTLELIRFVGGG